MSDKANQEKINEILTRGVGEFIDPEGIFKKKIESNPEGVVIKFGVDPTRPDLHLGHAVVLRKLRQFQDLGCKVIFLIGDYTTMIGDPTGKSKVRPEISQIEVEKNMKTYLDQVGKILLTDEKVFSWIRNSDWFLDVADIVPGPDSKTNININEGGKTKSYPIPPNSFVGKAVLFENTRMQKTHLHKPNTLTYSLTRVLAVLKRITHSRLIAREMFQGRIEEGVELYMSEMLYPVLQGIDSGVLAQIYGSCDLEVGGTDQTFNMLVGRDVMKMNKQNEQAVLAFNILVGTDGKEKMSKSLDNYISIIDSAEEMYGKTMSIPDSCIGTYFELCTFTPLDEVEEIKKKIKSGKINPRDTKMRLAREIVAIYHGEKGVKVAEEKFVNTFQKKEIPDDIKEIKAETGEKLVDVLLREKFIKSKSEFRRLAEQEGIHNLTTEVVVKDQDAPAELASYRIGKRKFIKIVN